MNHHPCRITSFIENGTKASRSAALPSTTIGANTARLGAPYAVRSNSFRTHAGEGGAVG